jgi:ferredoxin
MIVAERKPFEEIKALVAGYPKTLIVGCGTCVAVCLAGGEKEVGLLGAQLRLAAKVRGNGVRIDEITLERQCDREFMEPLAKRVEQYDALLSTACGAGVQLLAELFDDKPVLPALNTSFIGVAEGPGIWTERCLACGDCLLGLTGGICPVTMCAKGLLNGPCGGAVDGHCEVDPERACAWGQIYERLSKTGRLENLRAIQPPKRYDAHVHPAHLVHLAYKRRYGV